MYEGLKNLEIPTKRKHPGARRVAKYSLILLVCVAVFFGAAGIATYRYVQERLAKSENNVSGVKPAPLNGPLNILVLGSDDRTGLTKQELKELHISRAGGRRSDTIIMLRISPGKQAVMVHFPRDLLVNIPGQSGKSRINTSYAFGGTSGVVKTVKSLTGMDINYSVEVSFAAFKGLVDAIGGVSIYIPKPLYDRRSGLNLPKAGCLELDGTQSLAFVRARYIYPNADLGRIQAQQRFMRAMLGKVKSAGTMLDLFKVRRIADAVSEHVKISQGGADLRLAQSVAGALSDFGTDGVDFRVIPSSTRAGSPYVYVNETEARQFFTALKNDRPLPPFGKTGQSKVGPEDVRVDVFNGTGTTGLGGRETEQLRKLRFEARVAGNAQRVSYTVIRYAPDAQQKAALVAKEYPGAQVVLKPDQRVDVAVILGPDAASPATGTAKPKPPAAAKKPALGSACG